MPSSGPEPWSRLRQTLKSHEEERKLEGPDLPRYELRAELGRGGMAVVYRAWDRQLQREVAVKVLRKDRELGTAAARFRREAQVAAQLSHPNLVSVFDAGEKDGQMYLVMELVDGKPLNDLLIQGSLDLPAKIRLLEKASRGVAAAHERGIVHRDLKPGNILVTAAGEPKVGDFGLVHLVESDTALTRTGAALGTPLYMAPEQVLGRGGSISPQTDVYALGAILYEMIAGRPPHAGETSAEVFRRAVEDDPMAPRRINSKAPVDLETIALKALDKFPEKRYAHAGAFANDLARYLAGEPIEAKPLTLVTRMLRKGFKHRRVLLPTAAAAVVAAAFGIHLVRTTGERQRKVGDAIARARQLEGEDRLDEARGEYKIVTELEPGHREAGARFIALTEEIDRRRREQDEALKELETVRPALEEVAREYYRPDGNPDEVRRRAEEIRRTIEGAIRKSPKLATAHYLQGRAWELLSRDDLAYESHRKALALHPGFGPAHFRVASVLMTRMFEARAKIRPDEVVRALSDEMMASIRAATAAGSGFDDALQLQVANTLLAFVEQDPDRVRELAREGIAQYREREGAENFWWLLGLVSPASEALRCYDRALQIRPLFPWARFCRAQVHASKGDLPAAIADYTDALRINPAFGAALTSRGDARYRLKDYEGAIDDFDRAAKAAPEDPMRRFNLGNARSAYGDLDGAIEDYDAVLEKLPGHAATHFYRGRLVERQGRGPEALKDYDEALKSDPAYLDIYITRGNLRAELGDLAGALADFRHFLKVAPPSWPNYEGVRQEVERLAAQAPRDF